MITNKQKSSYGKNDELTTVYFIDPYSLKPSEKHDPKRANFLVDKIHGENIWSHPVLVERNTLVIMDGHHRHVAALALKLSIIPCLVASYTNPYLTLTSWVPGKNILAEDVINAGLTGDLLDYKSTRHQLELTLPKIAIPLPFLKNFNSCTKNYLLKVGFSVRLENNKFPT